MKTSRRKTTQPNPIPVAAAADKDLLGATIKNENWKVFKNRLN